MVGVVQCDRSEVVIEPVSKGGSTGKVGNMEEPSFCNLSLAVDCTLSLGSSAITTRTDTPARRGHQLSRRESPDHRDLDQWSLSVRSERDGASHRSSCADEDRSEHDNMSWGGSCNRSDSDVSPGYYPQVSERGAQGERRGFKAWPRSYKDEVNTSSALYSMIEEHKYATSSRASRQPWLSSYIPSSAVVEAKAVSSSVEQCMQEGDSGARVCAHCGTSKTPLWRNGPGGPKSLCNACGIRFKKAGRRSAANGGADLPSPPAVMTAKVAKRKLLNDEHQRRWMFPADAKPRKRSRAPTVLRPSADSLLSASCMTWQASLYDIPERSPRHPHHFLASPPSQYYSEEDLKLNLELGSFSSDEEEGAVLLMALSCGMVNA